MRKKMDLLLTAHPLRCLKLMIHLRMPAEQFPLTLASDDIDTIWGKMVLKRDLTPFLRLFSMFAHFLPTSSSEMVACQCLSTSFQSIVKFFAVALAGLTEEAVVVEVLSSSSSSPVCLRFRTRLIKCCSKSSVAFGQLMTSSSWPEREEEVTKTK